MRALIGLVGFLVVINVATCYIDSSTDIDTTSQYIRYLKQRRQFETLRKQFGSICEGKEEELDEAIAQLKECTDRIDENNETVCSAVKNHFLRCSKPFVQLLEQCLPEQSKEIPKLVFEGVNAAVGYLCKTDGEHIFELANNCVFKVTAKTLRCERRVKTKLQQYKDRSPTKNDVCELAQSMKPCLHTHLQDSCGHRITRESFMGLFDALFTPCKIIDESNQIEHNSLNEVELLA